MTDNNTRTSFTVDQQSSVAHQRPFIGNLRSLPYKSFGQVFLKLQEKRSIKTH